VQESKKQVETELTEMTTALDQEDSEETELKKQLIEDKNKLDTYEAAVKDNLAKTRHWKKEVSNNSNNNNKLCLKNRIIDSNSIRTWFTVIMSKISDKTAKFLFNHVYLFWGPLFIWTHCTCLSSCK